jgi:glutaredoxin 3
MPKVTMYATGSCPYCVRAERLLRSKGAEIDKIRIDLEPGQRAEMTARTGRYTVPQIYIGDRHVGGCDDLEALERAGSLDQLLTPA